MKRHLNMLNLVSRNVDSRHLQVLLALTTLGLFVLGSGAPIIMGGGGG